MGLTPSGSASTNLTSAEYSTGLVMACTHPRTHPAHTFMVTPVCFRTGARLKLETLPLDCIGTCRLWAVGRFKAANQGQLHDRSEAFSYLFRSAFGRSKPPSMGALRNAFLAFMLVALTACNAAPPTASPSYYRGQGKCGTGTPDRPIQVHNAYLRSQRCL